MRIKVTAGELSVMGQSLTELVNTELVGEVGYRVLRLVKVLGEEVLMVERAQVTIIERHGGTQTTPGSWSIQPDHENYPKAIEELNKLFAQELELDVDHVVLPAQTKIKPLGLLVLKKFVTVAEA